MTDSAASSSSEKKSKLTEQDFSLITQAQCEFIQKRYDNCLQTLADLELSMGTNWKIMHNKSIVEFYKNNCKDYKTLLNFFEDDNKTNDLKNKSTATVALFNKAVIFYHLRKYYAAIDILTPIVESLDDCDESIASNVGLLMLNLLLITNQHAKSISFLTTLQTHLGVNSESSSGEDSSTQDDDDTATDDGFNRMLKLKSLLTNVLNNKMVTIPDDETTEVAILKAHQYYLNKDFQMAAKELAKKFTSTPFTFETHGEDQDTCIANNMGVIHLRVRHYALAAKFFQQALTFDKKISGSLNDASLHYLGAPKTPEILYNLGISLMHLQRPKDAFECFLVPLKIYHRNPRLWLRIAETCIMLYEQSDKENEKKQIFSAVICSGSRRKYILEPSPKVKCTDDGQSFAIPNPNLEFATLCLRNAMSLIDDYKNKFSNRNDEILENSNWTTVEDSNYCNPSMPITKESFDNLIAAVYAAYSYVLIRLGDFVVAAEYAKLLLQLENISDSYKMLGHLYCAEALIMLDKVSEARTHLEPKFISSLNADDFETKNWRIKSLEAAQSVIRYNLVVALVLQGELDIAKRLLSTCTHPVLSTKVKILKTYLEIAGK